MKTPVVTAKNKAGLFGLLAVASFCGIFFLAPLGGFTVWLTLGATVYFTFMTIYSLVHRNVRPAVRPRFDPGEDEMKAYIKKHTTILIGIFLGALFFVMIFLFFVL
jgi:hypothetical protein